MDITPRKRSKIITLHEHSTMTQRAIAKECSVSLGAVNRLIRQKADYGSVSPRRKGHCGRRRKTTKRDDAMLHRMSKLDPQKTSDMLKMELEVSGIHVHSSTVRRRLLEGGRRAHRPVKKQLLTNTMKMKRYQWAKLYKTWTKEDWRRVIFSDESHFEVQGQRCMFVRKAPGDKLSPKHIVQTVKHPDKKMFWGCFSHSGTGPLYPVSGMMNSIMYKQVIQSKLIPEMTKRFPAGNGVFQQDLAPCHTSKMMKTFFNQNNITCLQWPGNSPDINPIENLWSIIKARLRNRDCTVKEKLICAVIQVWYHDPEIQAMCQKLVDSMPTRVAMLLKAKGGHTKYWYHSVWKLPQQSAIFRLRDIFCPKTFI